MMKPVERINDSGANPVNGEVFFDTPKAAWNIGMIVLAAVFAPFHLSIESLTLFFLLTYFSLLIGHSAGMHRLMIHRSYDCAKWCECLMIYIGVLVGMSGPFGIIKIHDLRDWAQRQKQCHPFFSHKKTYLVDLWWQLTSSFKFQNPPSIAIEAKYAEDKFYVFLEKTWRWHQLLLATILFWWGGWSFVVWGIFVRVSVSIIGHWSITYACHNPGPGQWRVKEASVQASNIPGLGIVTYGECWHNNRHAFPESAKIGLEQGQSDPAWWFIQCLNFLGIAKNIGEPRHISSRQDLYKEAN